MTFQIIAGLSCVQPEVPTYSAYVIVILYAGSAVAAGSEEEAAKLPGGQVPCTEGQLQGKRCCDKVKTTISFLEMKNLSRGGR